MPTGNELIKDALFEISVNAVDVNPSSDDQSFCQRVMNRILNQWAASKVYAYDLSFDSYTLTAAHQPHLIGPGLSAPDFAAPRPVRIESAALVLTNVTPNVDLPLAIRDDDWWANKRVKGVTSNVPTDLYYSASVPNGELWLWPVPTYAYDLRLQTWVVLAQISDFTVALELPYGYEEALYKTLIEKLCKPFSRPITEDIKMEASQARAIIQKNNDKPRRTGSADLGVGSQARGDFNYYTGGPA